MGIDRDLLQTLPAEKSLQTQPRPYINHSVQFKGRVTWAERLEALGAAGCNVFYFPSEMITGCDLLSDSGTSTMTAEQWSMLHAAGLPVLMPTGGHGVYLNMEKFFQGTDMRPEDFGGIAFTALLLGLYGHRACELGDFAFGHTDAKTGKEVQHEVNFVRFAIPRLRYEQQDLQSVVDAVKALHDNRHLIPKVEVIHGRDLPLRHFKARFNLVATNTTKPSKKAKKP